MRDVRKVSRISRLCLRPYARGFNPRLRVRREAFDSDVFSETGEEGQTSQAMNPSFRASELDRVLTCNGSISLVPKVAPRSGDEGHEGAWLHWMIAKRLIAEHGAVAPANFPAWPEGVPKNYKCPPFSVWIVDWAVRHVLETIPADWALLVEVPMSHQFAGWTNTGHGDVIGISPDVKKAKVIDFKTGRDPVDPADNNEQGADYLVLVKCEWDSIEEAEFQIAQPR